MKTPLDFIIEQMTVIISKTTKYSCIILTLLSLSACYRPSLEDKRKETMIAIVDALSKNDTNKLYSLIDTAFMIPIFSKENVTSMMNELHRSFFQNPVKLDKSDFSVTTGIPNTTNYQIAFFLPNGKMSDSVILVFKFNRGVYKMAYDIDASWHSIQENSILVSPGSR